MKDHVFNIKKDDILQELNVINPVESRESLEFLFGCIDLTSLNISDNYNSITELVEKVNEFNRYYPSLPAVAGICVFPRFVSLVRKKLRIETIKIVSVAASFPYSQTFKSLKIEECELAVSEGADEIDIVISVGSFLNKEYDEVKEEICWIKDRIGSTHLKVILETGVIDDPGLIYKASTLAMEGGADFIKTSTGKSPVSATPEAAWVMCRAIKDFYDRNGRIVGFKPAGGISNSRQAHLYLGIVDRVLGKNWLSSAYFRIGASRLTNELLSEIAGNETRFF